MKKGKGNGTSAAADHCLACSQRGHWVSPNEAVLLAQAELSFRATGLSQQSCPFQQPPRAGARTPSGAAAWGCAGSPPRTQSAGHPGQSGSRHAVRPLCCGITSRGKASLTWSNSPGYWSNRISGSFPQLQRRSSGPFVLMSWLKSGSMLLWGR